MPAATLEAQLLHSGCMSQQGLPPAGVRMPLEFAAGFGLWCWMSAPVSADVVYVGLGAALMAAITGEGLRALSISKFYPHLRVMSRSTPGVILDVFRDCALLLKELFLRLFGTASRGRFRTVPFQPGSASSRSETRRALALTLVTVSPNSLAIEIDRKRNVLLYHELVPSEPPRVALRMAQP